MPTVSCGPLSGRAALGKPRQAVVRDRLPRCCVRDELAELRPDARVLVEQPEPDAHHLARRIVAPERAPASAAEALRPSVRRRPFAYELLARKEAERARVDANLGRGGRAGPALAARAVAVGRVALERAVDLEPHTPAVAAPGEGEVGHDVEPRRTHANAGR